jgi:hypothetical protein
MQGVVRFYDPQSGEGVIIADTADRTEYPVAAGALEVRCSRRCARASG